MTKITKGFQFDTQITNNKNKVIAYVRIAGKGYWQSVNDKWNEEFADFDIESVRMQDTATRYEVLLQLMTCQTRGYICQGENKGKIVNTPSGVTSISLYNQIHTATLAHMEALFFEDETLQPESDYTDLAQDGHTRTKKR